MKTGLYVSDNGTGPRSYEFTKAVLNLEMKIVVHILFWISLRKVMLRYIVQHRKEKWFTSDIRMFL